VKTNLLAFVACSALFALTAVHAQTASSDATLTADPAYQKNCAKYHGKTSKAAAISTDDLRNMIANGKRRMPKFAAKLKPEEIDTLVQQIQSRNEK
jgi:mono/diheme cytochrome c family protein